MNIIIEDIFFSVGIIVILYIIYMYIISKYNTKYYSGRISKNAYNNIEKYSLIGYAISSALFIINKIYRDVKNHKIHSL